MALSATAFKVEVGVSDVDHGYYADHTLTVSRHPSETDERMVVRLLAFGLRTRRRQQLAQTVDRRASPQVMLLEGQVTMTVGSVDVTFTPQPLK